MNQLLRPTTWRKSGAPLQPSQSHNEPRNKFNSNNKMKLIMEMRKISLIKFLLLIRNLQKWIIDKRSKTQKWRLKNKKRQVCLPASQSHRQRKMTVILIQMSQQRNQTNRIPNFNSNNRHNRQTLWIWLVLDLQPVIRLHNSNLQLCLTHQATWQRQTSHKSGVK